MQLVLLSGGSGKRLWPLSNNSFSKQFVRLLPSPDGGKESMLQRIMRQIRESGLNADVTISTSNSQEDPIKSQLGNTVDIVIEPERRDTFPAIALACFYLAMEKHRDPDEIVVVMPSDVYTDKGYFLAIDAMASTVNQNISELALMGICPTYPSTKYGYIIPEENRIGSVSQVERFTEKPEEDVAKNLINRGALWNGGVFAFRLRYLLDIVRHYIQPHTYQEALDSYAELPKISFDYEVVERATSVAVIPFDGIWKDLGTWNTLSEVLGRDTIGHVLLDKNSRNTHVVNTLDIPCVCVGADNLIVATGSDGILVANKDSSEHLKPYVDKLNNFPMYEERRWGTCKVIGSHQSQNGQQSLIKHLCVKSGQSISYHRHSRHRKILTVVDGTGVFILDNETRKLESGDVVCICEGQKHVVKAITDLYLVEVQIGELTSEEMI